MTSEPPTNADAAASLGDVPPSAGEPVRLVCSELWGGNRAFYGPIELPGMRGVLFSQACDGARGGDIHYLSVCGSGLVSRVCLADVTGHGERVAAVSAAMHGMLRRLASRMDERKVLRRLNRRLCAADEASIATAGVLTYFPPTRRLSISYAGHEPAWYYDSARERWSPLEPVWRAGYFDLALAVEPRAGYTRRVRRVQLGDRLLLFTDGVLEAPRPGGELFGRERLADVLHATRHQPPHDAIAAIIESLRAHTAGAALAHDDVSLLLVEFVDNLAGPVVWTALRNRLFRRRWRDSVHNAPPRGAAT